jgi:hypothetical protein
MTHDTTVPHLPPHLPDALLHDLADGLPREEDRAAADRHLRDCVACAARLARLQRLLRLAGELPAAVMPAHDGWPSLRARLAAGASPATPLALYEARGAGVWPRRVARLAAALLLVAAGVWGVTRLPSGASGDAGPLATPGAARAGDPAAVAFAGVERDYARAAADLTAQLAATRDRLPPTVAASVDRSLATIDDALAEARAALDADPGNAEIAHFVTVGYERKLDLLRRTTALSSGD